MRRYTHQYDEVLERATRYLGEPRYLEGEDRLVLADNVNPAPRAARWRAPLIVTLVICAEAAESRDEFERLLGLHGSGYPSIMRSNVYYHGLANHYKRAGKARGMEPEEYHNDISRLKDARTQFRRVIRRAYHKIRQGRSEPVTGTVEPADTGQHSTRDGQNETRSGGA